MLPSDTDVIYFGLFDVRIRWPGSVGIGGGGIYIGLGMASDS